jgi:hypothetical protein
MTSAPGRPLGRRRRFAARYSVLPADDGVRVELPALGVSGLWTPAFPVVEVRLMDEPAGSITWRCVQAGGRVAVTLPNGSRVEGLGYAEKLFMTVAPWAVPFDELRWGRFVSERHAVVWIHWRGGRERRWAFADGAAVEADVVDGTRVAWPGGSVEIGAARLLREVIVGKAVVGSFAALLPRRIARAADTKWVARGRFERAGESAPGWVVHERVRWG